MVSIRSLQANSTLSRAGNPQSLGAIDSLRQAATASGLRPRRRAPDASPQLRRRTRTVAVRRRRCLALPARCARGSVAGALGRRRRRRIDHVRHAAEALCLWRSCSCTWTHDAQETPEMRCSNAVSVAGLVLGTDGITVGTQPSRASGQAACAQRRSGNITLFIHKLICQALRLHPRWSADLGEGAEARHPRCRSGAALPAAATRPRPQARPPGQPARTRRRPPRRRPGRRCWPPAAPWKGSPPSPPGRAAAPLPPFREPPTEQQRLLLRSPMSRRRRRNRRRRQRRTPPARAPGRAAPPRRMAPRGPAAETWRRSAPCAAAPRCGRARPATWAVVGTRFSISIGVLAGGGIGLNMQASGVRASLRAAARLWRTNTSPGSNTLWSHGCSLW